MLLFAGVEREDCLQKTALALKQAITATKEPKADKSFGWGLLRAYRRNETLAATKRIFVLSCVAKNPLKNIF
jgi:hypothetical protein